MNTDKSKIEPEKEEWDELMEEADVQEGEIDEPLTLANSDGVFFDYLIGYLDVEFISANKGDIFFEFHVKGDTVIRTPSRTEPFELGCPEYDIAEDTVLKSYASTSMSRFCYDMVHWLEAVACDVYQCSFSWDGEGPEGELNWHRHGDGGTLKLSWSGTTQDDQTSIWFAPAFEHTVRLNKEHMVRSFYESFRDFVESDRYDPNEYEGEWFGDNLLELRSTLVEKWLADGITKRGDISK